MPLENYNETVRKTTSTKRRQSGDRQKAAQQGSKDALRSRTSWLIFFKLHACEYDSLQGQMIGKSQEEQEASWQLPSNMSADWAARERGGLPFLTWRLFLRHALHDDSCASSAVLSPPGRSRPHRHHFPLSLATRQRSVHSSTTPSESPRATWTWTVSCYSSQALCWLSPNSLQNPEHICWASKA